MIRKKEGYIFLIIILFLVIISSVISITTNSVFDTKATYGQISVSVTVDAKAPLLTLDSPINTTYSSNTIQIKYTVRDEVSNVSKTWYNIDHGFNITLTGNTSISVTNCTHIFRIYANDTFNQVNDSNLVRFTVEASECGSGSSGSSSDTTTTESTSGSSSTSKISGSSGGSGVISPIGSENIFQPYAYVGPYSEGSIIFHEEIISFGGTQEIAIPDEWKDVFSGGLVEEIKWEGGRIIDMPEEFKEEIHINTPADWVSGVAYNIPPDSIQDFANNFLIAMACASPPCTVMSREINHEKAFKFFEKIFEETMLKTGEIPSEVVQFIKQKETGEIEIMGAVQLLCSGSVGSSEVSFDASDVSCSTVGTKVVHDDSKVEDAEVTSCNERSDGSVHATASFSGCSYLLILKINGNIIKPKKEEVKKEQKTEELKPEEELEEQPSPVLEIEKEDKSFLKDPLLLYGSIAIFILLLFLLNIIVKLRKNERRRIS